MAYVKPTGITDIAFDKLNMQVNGLNDAIGNLMSKVEVSSNDGAQPAANLETLREEVIKRTDYLNNKRSENEKTQEDSMNSLRQDTLQSLLELRQHMNAEVSKEFKMMEEKIRNDQAAFGEQVKKLLQGN